MIVPINLQDDKEKESKNLDENLDQKPTDTEENNDISKDESPRRTSIFLTDDHDENSSEDKLDEESSTKNDQDDNGCKTRDDIEDANNKESQADVVSISTHSSDLKLDEGAAEYNYSDASWEEDSGKDEDLDGRKSRLLDVDETRSFTYSADPDFSDAEDQKSTASGSTRKISEDKTSIHSNSCKDSSACKSGGMLDVGETRSYTYSADPDFSDAEDQKSTLSDSRGKISHEDETSIHSNRHQGSIVSNSGGGMLDVDETRSYTYSAVPDFSDAEDKSLASSSKGRVSEVDEKSINSNHNRGSLKSGSDGKLEVDEIKSYTYSADPDFSNSEDEKSVSSNCRQGSIVSSSGGKMEDGNSGVNHRRSSNASSRTEEYTRTESVVSLTEMVRKSVIEENEGNVVVYEK